MAGDAAIVGQSRPWGEAAAESLTGLRLHREMNRKE
jgi:hypothetical protein